MALAVVLGALVVLGGLAGWQRLRDGSIEASQPSTEDGEEAAPADERTTPSTLAPVEPPIDDPSPEPGNEGESGAGGTGPDPSPAPDPVEPISCPDRYSAAICDAADFVQRARGRPFKEFPAVELLADEDFDRALVDDLESSRDDLVEQELVLKSLALVPTDLDLFVTYRSLVEAGVVGFYDPETGRLAVRGDTELDLYGQSVLVHELAHAFDDQWFDLDRDDFAHGDAEYGFAAVVEGNASRVEEQWKAELGPEDAAALREQEFRAISPEDLDRLLALPRVILNLQISPYQDGARYVTGLARAGGEALVDEALVEPPSSSEQVLHPLADEAELVVVDVAQPPAGGTILESGTLGELLIGLWLGGRAGEGWGGDSYVIWSSEDRTCTTIDLAADSDADLAELESATRRWVESGPESRSVTAIDTVDRTVIRVDGCY